VKLRVPKRDMHAAIALYESFREKKPKRLQVVNVDIPTVVACIGHVEAIDYRTTHGKKLALYRHDFVPGSRPLLVVSPDGRCLMLLGGRFKFTDRGIVDRDASGREVENKKHGKRINPSGTRTSTGGARTSTETSTSTGGATARRNTGAATGGAVTVTLSGSSSTNTSTGGRGGNGSGKGKPERVAPNNITINSTGRSGDAVDDGSADD
jgi:hypothetical protein